MLKTAFGYAALEKVVGALHEVRNKMVGAAFKVYVANISNSTNPATKRVSWMREGGIQEGTGI
jgi:hypothetical protein